MTIKPPVATKESLARFKEDHRDHNKVAFIMIEYARGKPHDEIVRAIRFALGAHGFIGVLASDKQYHDELYYNILTYLHGCDFGVAVFERILSEHYNPNVSLEVGYMLALDKKICYLKDTTLTKLQSDITGKIYRTFDTYEPLDTIPSAIEGWLSDMGLAKSTPLTVENLIAYAKEKDSTLDFTPYALGIYAQLREIHVDTIDQLHEAIEDDKARQSLNEIYRDLLKREPDWIGIFVFQPAIYLYHDRGIMGVKQSILASPEYEGLKQKPDTTATT